jgi:D-alanine--poly(phosphoribitol) ligase subunit 1
VACPLLLSMDIVARVDEWSYRRPDRLAHISGERSLSYRELKIRSDALAAHLSSLHLDERSPIAVLGHKEPEMLIAFLGCIKAGHPYAPIDTSLPRQRIDGIIRSSGAQITLTPEFTREASATDVRDFVHHRMSPSDPFYIMFTSGSTGVPKGVVITLGCLTDFIDWIEAEHRFAEGEVFLNQVPYSFDVSVMDTYLALLTGGTVFSIGRDHIDKPIRLFQALASSAVSFWISTPAFGQLCLSERTFNQNMLPRLRWLMFIGETLPPSLVSHLYDRFPRAEVWNGYGPTETTIATSSVRIDRDMLTRYTSLPIGFPKPRTRMVVLDPDGSPVAPGDLGEIIIAGPNVSPGYLNSPEANKRAFFDLDGTRAYRTGDLGHFQDGMLFFDGRMDNQIKLYGHRVELGDVEAHLSALPDVRDVVVLPVWKDGHVVSLEACVVLRERGEGSDFTIANQLRTQLAERLPAHMLPRKFRFLDKFPMTVNGKVDRSNLSKEMTRN